MERTMSPQTPSRADADSYNQKINLYVHKLSIDWDLNLRAPSKEDSPKLLATLLTKAERQCLQNIKVFTYRNLIDKVYEKFTVEGQTLYNGWVTKPNAQRENLPGSTNQRPRCVLPHERQLLLDCFNRISERYLSAIKEAERSRGLLNSTTRKTAISIDDSPIPWPLRTPDRSTQPLRPIESTMTNPQRLTTSRVHTSARPLQPFEPLVTELSKTNRRQSASSNTPETKRLASQTDFGSPTKRPKLPRVYHSSTVKNTTSFDSVTTSFASDIFDPVPKSENFSDSSQETAPDPSYNFNKQSYRDGYVSPGTSSNYGSGIDSTDVTPIDVDADDGLFSDQASLHISHDANALSQNIQEIALIAQDTVEEAANPAEDKLRERLTKIFPDSMPSSFLHIPVYLRYEVLRISLWTGVPLSLISLPRRLNDLEQSTYDRLWNHLRELPSMKGKNFPPRASNQVWATTKQEVRQINRSVNLSGSLTYTEEESGPLFQFRLHPLKLEHSHRLGRRFGSDRFMEIDLPNITGKRLPKDLQKLGSKGKEIVIDWLRNKHELFGRSWMAFCSKPLRVKVKKGKSIQQVTKFDNTIAHRMFYFAFDGSGFSPNVATPPTSDTMVCRSTWSVSGLLNWLRPTQQNQHEPALKLYARTTLGLSRNIPTVVIERPQIKFLPDIEYNKECMTDGAGRISQLLAERVVRLLGYDYMPSGFQGRFGDAKGFWTIDPQDRGEEEWIEVYKQQRKWERNDVGPINDPDFDDPAHRTFEVISISSELKSAELNTQLLPILVDRAINKPDMIRVIEQILVQGLTEFIQSQRVAMENPLTCRKWIRETNPNITEKVKLGTIAFNGALPILLTERMNMLLDAGFHPAKLQYLRELVHSLFKQKCSDLKTDMKITVSRSAYAYMVPDFAGVLEEGEVYFHMSKNVAAQDMLSTRSNMPLQNIDLLVARLPAHFASDVQKVKAVVKMELFGLRDVIVFPIKGNPSLAAKLSGGDYDGDKAWVCWEQSIVSNFANAPVPEVPDLVAEGYIGKISTTYEDLVRNEPDPTDVFLKHSFSFNLEKSMLGRCTIFKEEWLYDHVDLTSSLSIYLSKLLSDLVDAAKQGSIFTEDDWEHFRKKALKNAKRNKPSYKEDMPNPKSSHIMDRLKCVAEETIDDLLTEHNKIMPASNCWDADVVKMKEWAMIEAANNAEWTPILKKLKEDIESLKKFWKMNLASAKVNGLADELCPEFGPIRDQCYEMYIAIVPSGSSALTNLLHEKWHGNPELSKWELLKASFTFASYRRNYVSNFVWWMAGRQLCSLKAEQAGCRSVIHEMYAMSRPDASFVRRRMGELEDSGSILENVFENKGEIESDEDGAEIIWIGD